MTHENKESKKEQRQLVGTWEYHKAQGQGWLFKSLTNFAAHSPTKSLRPSKGQGKIN